MLNTNQRTRSFMSTHTHHVELRQWIKATLAEHSEERGSALLVLENLKLPISGDGRNDQNHQIDQILLIDVSMGGFKDLVWSQRCGVADAIELITQINDLTLTSRWEASRKCRGRGNPACQNIINDTKVFVKYKAA
ncbi:hypothetical protein C8R45DRAFT_923161 [Mycena sanguinolenta]|nr:hypothetical protein C8R45DRAFT_923161 [Mycena sanguinolenta]